MQMLSELKERMVTSSSLKGTLPFLQNGSKDGLVILSPLTRLAGNQQITKSHLITIFSGTFFIFLC
jgi:hypothetical protein